MEIASSSHPYLHSDLFEIFQARFVALGGMTPEISKEIVWDN